MAANQDQVRRDAEHACRTEITLLLSKFQRRMYEHGKASIAEELAAAGGGIVDGTKLGRDAAAAAIAAFVDQEPSDVVEPAPTLEPGDDPA